MHRGAVRAGRKRLLWQDQADILCLRRNGRRDLDLYGASGAQAAAAEFRMGTRARPASLRLQADARMQTGCRRSKAASIRARLVPAPHDLRSDPLHVGQGAEFTRETDARFEVIESKGGMVIGVRRPATPGNLYWRVTQWVMPFHTMIPALRRQRAQRPRLRADRRRELHVMVLYAPSGAAAVRARAGNHEQRRRHPRQSHSRLVPSGGQQRQRLHDRSLGAEAPQVLFRRQKASPCRTPQSRKAPARSRTVQGKTLVSTDNGVIMARQRLSRAARAVAEGKRTGRHRSGNPRRAFGFDRAAGRREFLRSGRRCAQGQARRGARFGVALVIVREGGRSSSHRRLTLAPILQRTALYRIPRLRGE